MDSNYLLLGCILILLFLSTLFSISPFISLIGDTEKGHTSLLFFNLLGLFLVLRNFEKEFLLKLIFTSLLAGLFASIIALKEFFFPSFEYGELGNRALGTFGHPNYLAGYLLLLFPIVCSLFPFSKETRGIAKQERVPWGRIQVRIRIIVWILFSLFFITLILTKSIWALFLILGYFISTQFQTHLGISSLFKRKGLPLFFSTFIIFLGIFFLIKFHPEKLHSFLSRIYLWESTLRIIFSDPKIFFFGGGAETLPYYFDSFKVPEIYIFENFGFTADRVHNFFLQIFYNFGVFGAILFFYFLTLFYKNFKNFSSPEKFSLLMFILFGIFHYFSIASYIIIILLLALCQHNTSLNSLLPGEKRYKKKMQPHLSLEKRKICDGVIIFLFTLLSLTGAYYSFQLYQSEILFASGNTQEAQKNFSHPKYLIELGKYSTAETGEGILSQNNLKHQIITEPERLQNCEKLTQYFPSAENYFYCGNIFEKLDKPELAKSYYQNGLKKLPDLWNSNSLYWNNYFIKHTITGNRFFSEKFGNIREIVETY